MRWKPAASWYAFASAISSISPNGRAKNVTLVGDPVSAKPFGTLPVGIPVPKSNPKLRDAVQAALKKVIDSGTYDALLAKWNLQDQALKGAPINTGQ